MSAHPTLARGRLEDCKFEPGVLAPRIDPERCEGKGPCVEVCPAEVFELRRPTDAERATLGWVALAKVWVHGGKQGFVVDEGACRGCGLCVTACPEKAITLGRAARIAAESA